MSTVRYKRRELPPLTEERVAALDALAKLPDESIDYSDIPALCDERCWPFESKVPNAVTREAMAEADEIVRVHRARLATAAGLFDEREKNSDP